MDCPNHKEYPDCPYGFLRPKANWQTGDLKSGDYRICLTTPCSWRIEKQNEEILRLLKDDTEEILVCLDATSRHYKKRCNGFCERYDECTIKGRKDIE